SIVQKEHQPHAAADAAGIQHSIMIDGSLQVSGRGLRAVLRMSRNADRISAEAFNLVVPALGFYIHQRAWHQAVENHSSRYVTVGRHISLHTFRCNCLSI